MSNKNDKERIDYNNIESCHGLMGDHSWPKPICVVKSDVPNRKDQGNMTSASEYLDEPDVLEQKMEIVAQLIKKSKFVVAYTGAGLSRASGIGDYASKAKDSLMNDVPKLKSAFDAKPTYAHHVISKLEQVGLLHYYVQQNHDGLPQKAGFPQEKMNEIHGAWYDPSNQVVQFSESLRSDLFQEMAEVEKKVDLCICLGTSLSGMNADRMAWTPAKKYKKNKSGHGTIMINLQKTSIDDSCSVRIWAKIDDAFKILAQKLSLDMSQLRSPPKFDKDIFYIPYNEKGEFQGHHSKKLMKLDFREGAKIRIVHPDSSCFGVVGTVYNKHEDHYSILMQARKKEKECLYALGNWWIDLAQRGGIKQFSYANEDPEFVDRKQTVKSELTYGNLHQVIDNESHKWKVYVESDQNDIKKVQFDLHPTFSPSQVVVEKGPFEVTRTGWGTFPVGITVEFNDGKVKKLKHDLSFKGSGVELKNLMD